MRFMVIPLGLGIVLAAGAVVWFASRPDAGPPAAEPVLLVSTPGLPWFMDATEAAHIDFQHFDPATPSHFILETMGSGIAWIDFDADGWPDLFCVQAGPVPPAPQENAPTNRLYRNRGDGTFENVTERTGLARGGFGMGAAVGDFDNDGFDDLLVTYFGGIVLYRNVGDEKGGRRFEDITERTALRDPHWATSAAWGDIDGDGDLDLYVCNYCAVNLAKYPVCRDSKSGEAMSCPPSHFAAVPHRLYRNDGGSRFTDVTESSGIGSAAPAPGLAVAMVDFDGDGRLDIYVANDMKPAYLFHNRGGGKFEEKALLSGCAMATDGQLVAGMCAAIGDADGSGRPSVFVTNFDRKPNVLFLNRGELRFSDWGMPSGLGGPSIARLGFGAAFLDADLDGHLDVVVANGHIHRSAEKVVGSPYGQDAQLFLGNGRGKYRDVSGTAGTYFRQQRVGRGVAIADYNRDGRPDIAISHVGGRIALLRNETQPDRAWLSLDLVGDGVKSNRNAVGTRVEVESGDLRQVHWVIGGGSYLSASERRVPVGLGPAARADRVAVTWPSGHKQEFRDLAAKRAYRVVEGKQPEPRE